MIVQIQRRGLMLVLSSPSGAGKTTIASQLVAKDKYIKSSISVTTRPPRPGEADGQDYFFVSEERFHQMHSQGELLEHAHVFGHYYGTPKKFVFDTLESGFDIVFDIDWQGTQQLAHYARADLVSIFILPPSAKELYQRLRSRGQDSEETITYRMERASQEMSHWPEYDYVIINQNLESSIFQVQQILQSERIKRHRLLGLTDFVNQLRETH